MFAPQPIPPRGNNDSPVVRPDALSGLPNRPLGEFVNRSEPPASPNDIAMADDPSAAGAQAIFHLSRPLEGLTTRNGPLRPDGTDPTQNATSHGCTAKTIHVSEVGHYREIQGHLYAEHRPESNDEAACVDRMATARFMGEKCDRAIQSQAINAIDKHKAERRKPLEAEIVRLETSLRIWERARARKIVFGQGSRCLPHPAEGCRPGLARQGDEGSGRSGVLLLAFECHRRAPPDGAAPEVLQDAGADRARPSSASIGWAWTRWRRT
ncbi:MAG: hypothetical protein U0800_21670 [Isosphaeraceae bacterium]